MKHPCFALVLASISLSITGCLGEPPADGTAVQALGNPAAWTPPDYGLVPDCVANCVSQHEGNPDAERTCIGRCPMAAGTCTAELPITSTACQITNQCATGFVPYTTCLSQPFTDPVVYTCHCVRPADVPPRPGLDWTT